MPQLVSHDSRTRVLMISGHAVSDYVARAFAAGALGFVLKSQPKREIVDAIRRVAAGERYLSPQIPLPSGDAAVGGFEQLTRREHEIFDLTVRGRNNRTIAALLYISVKTVETHRTRIYRKLGAHSVGELVRIAARNGMALD
jgi:DNA-binding NarL/FixJ family response regulator